MPLMPCLTCGVPSKKSRCDYCESQLQQAKPRARASSNARGYDYDWQKVRIRVLNRDNWTCNYCKKKLFNSDATVDHIVPLSRGGERLDSNNLVAACRSCNSAKKNN